MSINSGKRADSGIIDTDMTVSEWGTMWLETYKRDVEYNTYEMYESRMKKYIIPTIGGIKLKNLKTIQIQQLINSITDEGHYRTADIVLMTIKAFTKQAVQEGFISHDIAQGVKHTKSKAEEKRSLTDVEKQAIQNADLTERQKMFLDIMLYTGLRRGEVLALTVKDINIDQKVLTVNKSLMFKENDSEIKRPKSKAGNREVPIPKKLIDSLNEYINELEGDILFPMGSSQYMTRSSFTKFWKGIIKQVKKAADDESAITFTPHIFRHTYATSLYYAGIDMKTSQYYLGHSSLAMTLEIYTHLDRKKLSNEIDKLNEFLKNE